MLTTLPSRSIPCNSNEGTPENFLLDDWAQKVSAVLLVEEAGTRVISKVVTDRRVWERVSNVALSSRMISSVTWRTGELSIAAPPHIGRVKFAGNMPFSLVVSFMPISQPSSCKLSICCCLRMQTLNVMFV